MEAQPDWLNTNDSGSSKMTTRVSHNNKDLQAIRSWIYQRNHLLVSWNASAGLAVSTDQLQATPSLSCQKLKQQLVDYTSAAHFRLYAKILELAAQQGHHEKQQQFQKLYPKLVNLTMEALDYSEKDVLDQEQLSRIGENISTRFEMEDQLLSHLQL